MAAVAEALALLRDLPGHVEAVTAQGRGLLQRLRGEGLRTEKGCGALRLRALWLLLYLQDLALLLAAKARGEGLGGLRALPRLLESRVVLEKLRPLELRLRYRLEKLLRLAAAGGRGDNDPLSFRPHPGDMVQEGEGQDEAPAAPKAPGLGGGRRYRPPRLVPVSCEAVGQRRGAQEAALRRALSGSVIRELREELGEGPVEMGGGGATGPSPAARRRVQHEESLLQRVREPRRRRGGGAGGGGELAAITHFGAFGALLQPANQDPAPPPKKKRKLKPKKGFRRRRRRR